MTRIIIEFDTRRIILYPEGGLRVDEREHNLGGWFCEASEEPPSISDDDIRRALDRAADLLIAKSREMREVRARELAEKE